METVVGLYSEIFEAAVVLGVFHGLFNNIIYQRIKIPRIYDWQIYQYSTYIEPDAWKYVKILEPCLVIYFASPNISIK